MARSPRCEKTGLKKGPWTPEEDQKLIAFIQQHGHGSWRALPAKAGLRRCGKSCRLRWTNYLRPDIKRGKFSLQEEQTIIQLHALLGNRWSAIASHLPKRTDNEIKNYWNTHLKKRLIKMGIDPTTHKPKQLEESQQHQQLCHSNLSHIAQWESARLQAEARLVRESKLQQSNLLLAPSSHNKTILVLNKIPPRPSLPPCLDILKAWQTQTSLPPINDNKNNNYKTLHMHMMHSMYAMMLKTHDDHDDLESATSTLCFPNNATASSMVSTNPINDNYLLLPPTTDNTDLFINTKCLGTSGGEGAIMNKEPHDDGDTESWRYLTKHDPETQHNNNIININNNDDDDEEKTLMYGTMSCLQDDDDIMVVVEAFRRAGHANNVTLTTPLSTNVVERFNSDMPFCSNGNLVAENLDSVNGDGSSSDVNFEENKNYYWNL